jgi:chromate transporter
MSAPTVPPAEMPATPPPPPSLLDLFISFSTISLSGFGGVLAWSRRMLVEERKWMTPAEFNEAYALCQFLPGANIVNLSVVFGRRIRGAPGSVVALLGLVGTPFLLVIAVSALYARFGDVEALQRMLTAVSAAAAGLIISTCAKMAEPLFRERPLSAPLMVALTFACVGVMRWPLYWVLAVLVPLSIALAWRWRR